VLVSPICPSAAWPFSQLFFLIFPMLLFCSFKHRSLSLVILNKYYSLLPNSSQVLGDVFTRPKAQADFAYVRKGGGGNIETDIFTYKIKSGKSFVHENTFFLREFQKRKPEKKGWYTWHYPKLKALPVFRYHFQNLCNYYLDTLLIQAQL